MSLFDRFRLLAIGTKLPLIELFRGYILVAVILGVDMTIQENAAANAPRARFCRILPDVLKYMPLILALVGLVFPFVVRARSTGIHGSAGWTSPKDLARLTRGDDGLLVERDPHLGGLLRHDGPGHLLTMAPTRTSRASAPSSPIC
jgi:type IV secretion system protein VirD4